MITSIRSVCFKLMLPRRGLASAAIGSAFNSRKITMPAVSVSLLRRNREFRATQLQENNNNDDNSTEYFLPTKDSCNCHTPFTKAFLRTSPNHHPARNSDNKNNNNRTDATISSSFLWSSSSRRLIHTGYVCHNNSGSGQPTSNAPQMPADESLDSKKVPFSGVIPVGELEFKYCRSGGAGGQHVNKVATKVELRFNVMEAKWIPDWIKPRLMEQQANRITKHGEFIVTSDKTRKQIVNQGDCLNRLRMMIFDASKLPEEPTEEELQLAEKRRARRAANILKEKKHHSLKKRSRGSQGFESL